MKPAVMKPLASLSLVALLSGCMLALPAPPPAATPGGGPGAMAPPTAASGGAAACRSEAEAQLLTVRGVASTQEIPGSGGRIVAENVMLDVSRGGQNFTVRCAYTRDSGEARIMTL